MKRWKHEPLRGLITELFETCGCETQEARCVTDHLVDSNLAGHDSHGVLRAPYYVDYVRRDQVRPNQSMEVVFRTDSFAIVDGQFGFGQIIGEQAMALGIEMAGRSGLAAIAIRNSGHLGRIGDWALQTTAAGMASFHFVNTSGFGLLVAPFGGVDRRLSANPLAAGVPVAGQRPVILDISTSAIAEGKLKVARNAGESIPPGCVIDHEGQPTTSPADFYADPPGALLPFGGHKGYGLSIVAEFFAGALTGNGCTDPDNAERLLNGMFTIVVDPRRLPKELGFDEEVRRFIDYVKSSRRTPGVDEILLPGEIEDRTREDRLKNGIPLDDSTWSTIVEACQEAGVRHEWVREG
ncbi:MAG: malate/lactate/ureidoglycolate dehydrogenase [Planctomycetota bacterium]